jgi:hypothetical protein
MSLTNFSLFLEGVPYPKSNEVILRDPVEAERPLS